MATERQIKAGAVALLTAAAARDGVELLPEHIDTLPPELWAEALEDSIAVLEAAAKASLIVTPGDLQ